MLVFYDVDTQNDFINSNGALSVQAESLKPNLKELTGFAKNNGIKIIGSVDRHFGTKEYKKKEIELSKWEGPFPLHCMDGTTGQKKIDETIVGGVKFIPGKKLSRKELTGYLSAPQIIFEKQSYDVFASEKNPGGNMNIDNAVKILGVKEVILYGVATDYCVKAAAVRLRERGIKVRVVIDAVKAVNVNKNDGKKALEEMSQKGVEFIKTVDVLNRNKIF